MSTAKLKVIFEGCINFAVYGRVIMIIKESTLFITTCFIKVNLQRFDYSKSTLCGLL
jgi:hypothetical protein